MKTSKRSNNRKNKTRKRNKRNKYSIMRRRRKHFIMKGGNLMVPHNFLSKNSFAAGFIAGYKSCTPGHEQVSGVYV